MQNSKTLPSKRWASFDGWDYNGMKERLEAAIENVDKAVLIQHAERIIGQQVTMNQPFSAGQYWVCFEMVADDGSLIIARVRLPRHPDCPPTVTADDEAYAISCEITTMKFVKQRLPHIPVPCVYAYEGPGSKLSLDAGASYMLIEGFYGNTLKDVEFDICNLSPTIQNHITTQWTKIQADLATLTFPEIGSICSVSEGGDPTVGRLAASFIAGELSDAGPFSKTIDYFRAIANAAITSMDHPARLGAYVFRDIINNTHHFEDSHDINQFPLNHMDLGTQNILVDDDYNFIAVIDWEFAQTAPWQVNHYPMPFPLLGRDIGDILEDPSHIAYKNVLRQSLSRQIYSQKFKEAEIRLKDKGQALRGSFAETLQSPASRIYACFTNLGRLPEGDAALVCQMTRLAYGFQVEEAERYIQGVDSRSRESGDVGLPQAIHG